ncbi:hypothetical protein P3S68_023724 [Capsicum galapagoense]
MVKKKLAFDDIAYTLPSDILFLILTRVPVKSLLRFKCVCKAWNVMISDNELGELIAINPKHWPAKSYC